MIGPPRYCHLSRGSIRALKKVYPHFNRVARHKGVPPETLSTADQPYPSGCSHGLRGKIIINPMTTPPHQYDEIPNVLNP